MRIKLVSDLHLEFSDINIQDDADYDLLILSGDIMIAQDLHDHPETDYGMYSQINLADLGRRQQTAQRFRDFLKRCSFQFPHVIYVAGNHEFYHGKWYASLQYLKEECDKFPNVYFLECDTKEIDGVLFIGATLWTDLNKGDPMTVHSITTMMNDFRLIRNDAKNYSKVSPQDFVSRHRQTLAYIKDVVDKNPDKKCVVVGHHSPSYLSIHEYYKNEYHMNGAYHSNLSNFILDRPQIKLWTHGHTHHAFDYLMGECRIVCNPRGYQSPGYSEDTGWDPKKVIII